MAKETRVISRLFGGFFSSPLPTDLEMLERQRPQRREGGARARAKTTYINKCIRNLAKLGGGGTCKSFCYNYNNVYVCGEIRWAREDFPRAKKRRRFHKVREREDTCLLRTDG